MKIHKRFVLGMSAAVLFAPVGLGAFQIDRTVMSDEYWKVWNEAEQKKIDADIEKNRKADARVFVSAKDGDEVTIEQMDHDFRFGAHIFNFNQLGKKEYNAAYKSMYGKGGLFNQATVSFYWKDHEPAPGDYRFDEAWRDTEEYWNSLTRAEALEDPYWRRPAPSPVINFLKAHDVAVHGHILVWGQARPLWIEDWYCPENEKRVFDGLGIPRHSAYCGTGECQCALRFSAGYSWERRMAWGNAYWCMTEKELAEKTPIFAKRLRGIYRKRVESVAARFGGVADSWDVVNESSFDWVLYRKSRTGLDYWYSVYGLMPGDYPLMALLDAKELIPPYVKLAINDYNMSRDFLGQVEDLTKEGARIDIVGCQMHLMDTNDCARAAKGEKDVSWVGTPAAIRERLDMIAEAGRPLHVSEVTIAAPGEDEKSRQIQAVLVRNIYRAWFSHPKVMGITWWNTVDGAGFAGEPLVSGLWTIDMKKKPAYEELDELINHEWRTNLRAKAKDGFVKFRGFRGKYRIGWTCATCAAHHTREVYVTGDGLVETERLEMPCERVVRKLKVDGKDVTLKLTEQAVDLAKIYPNGVGRNGKDGTQWAEITFNVNAPAAGVYRIGVNPDWWGEFVLDDGKKIEHGGPFVGVLQLKEGRNQIRYRSRAGCSGKWKVGFSLPPKAKLTFAD